MNTDYIIAQEYLNKLPNEQRIELINRTLGQEVKISKKEEREIRKSCSDYIRQKIRANKI
ncbi:hypothetical protein [Chryseobacterium gallinarum]|uniref:Uncharacterized protein n=1 Tax=Chryseobacterium gallinarum TaxID=1324352 RepID=A0ABX6KW97_CHRGL|nr:hypothetical protein [Chryseobacterium gallinarum]QIY92198.1 hypothetical protein FOB44_16700 [Chryseobacterium gallinarum]